jgi:hypothetical protein
MTGAAALSHYARLHPVHIGLDGTQRRRAQSRAAAPGDAAHECAAHYRGRSRHDAGLRRRSPGEHAALGRPAERRNALSAEPEAGRPGRPGCVARAQPHHLLPLERFAVSALVRASGRSHVPHAAPDRNRRRACLPSRRRALSHLFLSRLHARQRTLEHRNRPCVHALRRCAHTYRVKPCPGGLPRRRRPGVTRR